MATQPEFVALFENRADLRERLAAVAHEIWCNWMRWQFDVSAENPDGSLTIPAEKVERWKRQMATAYADLPEAERPSDREQADKIIEVLQNPPIRFSSTPIEIQSV